MNGTHPEDEEIDEEEEKEKVERSMLRLAALEFMVSLSEAKPGMVRRVPGWTEVLVRACLEGMGEWGEGKEDRTEEWCREDVRRC